MSSLKNYLFTLNLFEPPPDSNEREDEQQRHSNIIATRVYLVVLTLILIGVALVLWLNVQTTIVTINYPTEDQFEVLSDNAQCPCSRISLSYGEFTLLQPIFHQICSSDFVSDRWIKAINSGSYSTYFFDSDFRTFGSAQFQALAGFCRLFQASVQKNIVSFDLDTLISPQVISETVLRSQTQASIDQFQLTLRNTLGSQLQLIREMITYDWLTSGLQTNAALRLGTLNKDVRKKRNETKLPDFK